MLSGRLHFLLVAAVLFVLTALTGLQALADAGLELSAPELAAAIQATGLPPPAAEPPRSFAERWAEAGSLEQLVAGAPDGWVPVAGGVDYSFFQLPGPVRVHVARMDRANQALFLETSIGLGRLTGGTERTSSQFARYEGAVNYWGEIWGNTNDVLVAINGSFYDGSGVPDRGMVQSGWYAKRFANLHSGSGFVWKLNRTAFIGECVTHLPEKQVITYLPGSDTETFQGINTTRNDLAEDGELIIYTHHYAASTETSDQGVEVVVRLQRPMLAFPEPGILGDVIQIRNGAGNTRLYFDQVVLSAVGEKRENLLANLQVGDQIGISNNIKNFKEDCQTTLALDWSKAYASLGGGAYYLRNGQITSPGPTNYNPLTSIAFNDQHIFFIVVDGRAPGQSIGMTIDQLANFAKNTLGATYGINQDGGGSSTMVIDGVVVNTPSDMHPAATCHQVFLPMVLQEPVPPPTEAAELEEIQALPCDVSTERPVANGMMIVALQPKTLSNAFFEGAGVVAAASATVRLGPGTNFSSIATVAQGTSGVVLGNANGMNGVYAKGAYWWLVDFGSVRGWVSEGVLAGD